MGPKNHERLRKKIGSVVPHIMSLQSLLPFVWNATQSHPNGGTLPVMAGLPLGQMEKAVCTELSEKTVHHFVPGSKAYSCDLLFLGNGEETKQCRLALRHKEAIPTFLYNQFRQRTPFCPVRSPSSILKSFRAQAEHFLGTDTFEVVELSEGTHTHKKFFRHLDIHTQGPCWLSGF